jgi:hypothetical protein
LGSNLKEAPTPWFYDSNQKVAGTIWRRKIIAKKLCPIAESILSQPFSLSSSLRRIQAKQLEDKEEEEPRIRIEERWPVSIIIVS